MKLLIVATILAIGAGVYATRAECAFCPSFTCYSSAQCGQGCLCLKRGFETGGSCFSAD